MSNPTTSNKQEAINRAKKCAEDRKLSGYMCAGCQFQSICGIFSKTCPNCGEEHSHFQDFRNCNER